MGEGEWDEVFTGIPRPIEIAGTNGESSYTLVITAPIEWVVIDRIDGACERDRPWIIVRNINGELYRLAKCHDNAKLEIGNGYSFLVKEARVKQYWEDGIHYAKIPQ